MVLLLELPGTRAEGWPGARICVAACMAEATLKLTAARSLSAMARPPLSCRMWPSDTSAGETVPTTGEMSSKPCVR